MRNKSPILNLKYKKYINDITVKHLNIYVSMGIILLVLLMLLDFFIRKSPIAMCTRLPSVLLASIILFLNNFPKKKDKSLLTVLYHAFLVSIYVMMLAKFLVHFGDGFVSTNVLGIIIAVFIISLDLRTNTLKTTLIYLLPLFLFFIVFYLFFYSYFSKDFYTPLINILIFVFVGFVINKVQSNFRFKVFEANYFLDIEKEKLRQLNVKLEEIVEDKTKSLKLVLKKAKESDNLKTSFLQNISHEIRTPLNAVEGFIQILSNRYPNISKEYNIIKKSLDDLTKTIDDILLLSKLQVNESEINITNFNINDLINEMFIFLQNEIEFKSKNILPVLDFNKYEKITINADKDLLKKAIIFILENAVKFSESGEIKLACYKNDKRTVIKITDNGQGISEKDLLHVFDYFRKFEDKDNLYRGVGIGMSIAKGLIDLHSGYIKVNSKKGKGTSVEIFI